MLLPWHQSELRRLLGEGDRLSHALLIRGAEGIGKAQFAHALAQAILCEAAGRDGMACGQCSSCEWISRRSHPDFRVVEPENLAEQEEEAADKRKASAQIGVDQIRSLTDLVNLTSHRGRAKVILIHPAEAMNASAANALLKSLEEPPAATYFLLVSHRWHLLPATIKSRCRDVVLPSPDLDTARAWLVEQGTRQADLALAQAGGAPVSAARLEPEYWQQREAFLGAISSPDFDALRSAEQLRDLSLSHLVRWLQQWSYDMALQRAVGRVRYNPDFAEQIQRLARRADLLDTLRLHREMLGWQRVVHHPLNPRLFLEELLLSYGALINAPAPGRTA